jgi:hypothetical protein
LIDCLYSQEQLFGYLAADSHHYRWHCCTLRPMLIIAFSNEGSFMCQYTDMLRHGTSIYCGTCLNISCQERFRFYEFISKWMIVSFVHSSILWRIWLHFMAFYLDFLGGLYSHNISIFQMFWPGHYWGDISCWNAHTGKKVRYQSFCFVALCTFALLSTLIKPLEKAYIGCKPAA